MIRVLVLAIAAAFALAPAAVLACPAHEAHTAQASSIDMAAKKKAAPAATTDGKGDTAQTTPAK